MEAILPGTVYERIHPDEKDNDSEEQTVFVFRHLSMAQDNYITPKMLKLKDQTDVKRITETTLEYLDLGLVEVKNFKSGSDSITLERDSSKQLLPGGIIAWKREDLEKIPKHVRTWIYTTIAQDGKIEESELKNS